MIKAKFSAQVNLGFGDSEQSTGKRGYAEKGLCSFKNTKITNYFKKNTSIYFI